MIHVIGMLGLGDNIYQRAFVKALARTSGDDILLTTPWPELYDDIPGVQFEAPATTLRTQLKNVRRQDPARWVRRRPRVSRTIRNSYHAALRRGGNMITGMEIAFGLPPDEFDLPPLEPSFRGSPYAVIRPVTVRAEWLNTARNPLPEYVAHCAADLMRSHFVLRVADLEDGRERLEGDAPPAHCLFDQGELDTLTLLACIASADVVVGGAGWIVPACIATATPLFCILGGQGMLNAPEKLTDKRMRLRDVHFATPDRFCRCDDARHACDKRISNLAEQWAAFRRERGGATARAGSADMAA